MNYSIISITELIKAIHEKHPELRVCQIISNAAQMGGWKENDVFYCPDHILQKGLEKMLFN